ncbi:DUF1707 domain-containing protein [Streptomyces sp. NBC_00237]|uniref:DUF1707 SHOCT-like domain-containing protein n=1 Tax=Streptomyces sp. NBC_00237 TaxID=2975687 RepID=UPI0022570DF3|nr:DUF1707 domain-containing protein [Streptomyces sp. NBC_00237]MCX5200952.1 DUF1707 domain-containing protein [Streptomyces sp. NBC_00237]
MTSSSASDLPELRASDADRERVAEVLREAVAEGRLDMEEFDERLGAVFRSRTHGELQVLVRDLPVSAETAPMVLPELRGGGATESWASRIGVPATSKGAFAFWGGFKRWGTWSVPRTFTAFAMWGGGEIDLREARFEEREVTIRCFTIMGGIVVKVPQNLHVQVNGIGIMGDFDDKATGEGTPGSPRVRVTGFALMGGVGVERKLRKAEKARLREERRKEL